MALEEKVNYLRFNQDQGCFICCLDSGVRVYNIEPLTETLHKSSSEIGSISMGEMRYRTNLVAIVGGGTIPKFADNALLLYDPKNERFFCELTFTTPVISIRMLIDRVVVTQLNEIHVFTLPNDIEIISSLKTRDNPLGLCEVVCSSADKYLMCYPAQKCGAVQLMDILSPEAHISQSPILIHAHDNELACLSLNRDGTILATASTKGTLIRVWDTIRRVKITEFRRGTDPAILYCINFSGDSEYLCCSSDKGTIHIFALKDPKLNKRSTFSQMGFLGGYVESQWALATFTVPPERACICAFGANSSIYAICYDGSFHKYVFTNEGNCNRESFDVFLDVSSDSFF